MISRSPLLLFTGTIVATCLLLQRFGFPFGSKAISIVGPIGLIAAANQVWHKRLVFNSLRGLCFLAMFGCATVGLSYNFANPNPFWLDISMQSTAQFFIMTSFATIEFAQPVSERRFFHVVNAWLALIAIAGILQFLAQFAGLGLFSFRGVIPSALLFEDGYNLIIPLGIGSLIKSNGFFLLEPSIFSQLMAIGIIIEILSFRRSRYLALLGVAMLLSGAGTGWLVLIAFVVSVTVSLGGRGAMLALLTTVITALLIGGVLLLAPDVAAVLAARVSEISRPGTSGHLRFITPFWALEDVLSRVPAASIIGMGGGTSERLVLPYEFDVNTPVKIVLEYGIPALVLYCGTIMFGRKSPIQRALLAPAIVLLMFTGGYQQFPPILFFVLLIISVAWLEADQPLASSIVRS